MHLGFSLLYQLKIFNFTPRKLNLHNSPSDKVGRLAVPSASKLSTATLALNSPQMSSLPASGFAKYLLPIWSHNIPYILHGYICIHILFFSYIGMLILLMYKPCSQFLRNAACHQVAVWHSRWTSRILLELVECVSLLLAERANTKQLLRFISGLIWKQATPVKPNGLSNLFTIK